MSHRRKEEHERKPGKKIDTRLTSNLEAACTYEIFAILPTFMMFRRPMSKSYKRESTVMMAVKTALTV
jgi:hypothetical protein